MQRRCGYLLSAPGALAEDSQLSDWFSALSEGDCHQNQQIKAKLLTATGKLRLQPHPLEKLLTHTRTRRQSVSLQWVVKFYIIANRDPVWASGSTARCSMM